MASLLDAKALKSIQVEGLEVENIQWYSRKDIGLVTTPEEISSANSCRNGSILVLS